MQPGRDPVRDLWVPMRRPEDRGSPRAMASQMLEMLILYQLIDYAWVDGDKFDVADHGMRRMGPEEVLSEYGEWIALMVAGVIERSTLTTTQMSVPVGRAEGPVPYIADVTDRITEYRRYW